MDANKREWKQMNTKSDLLFGNEVYQIVGAAMEVLNELGHGLHEKPYENALVVEFGLRGIPHVQQPHFDVLYKGVRVSEYAPDLIAFGGVVVDAKVIEAITNHERGKMLNYLKIAGLKVGVILNFKRSKLEWERIVLESGHSSPLVLRETEDYSCPDSILSATVLNFEPRIDANGSE
jgi:GxxExxY protein